MDFFLLPVALLNFTEKTRWGQILQEPTLLAYFQTLFCKPTSLEKQSLNNKTSSNKNSHIETLSTIYEFIKVAAKPHTKVAEKSVARKTRNQKHIPSYLLFFSYTGDILEC